MKLKIIYFVGTILISSLAKAQIIPWLDRDSSKTYHELKLKNGFDNPISGWTESTIFNDSVSFRTFLDSVSEMKAWPSIDFDKYQVGLYSYCAQCTAHCRHGRFNHDVCHRNACMFTTAYYTQDRRKREEVMFRMVIVPDFFYNKDTMITTKEGWEEINKNSNVSVEIDFEKEVLLHRSEGGDCHAWFTHELFLDHSNKKMVWKIFNHYGGCRAGLLKEFLVKVPRPPEGYSISFKEVLMD